MNSNHSGEELMPDSKSQSGSKKRVEPEAGAAEKFKTAAQPLHAPSSEAVTRNVRVEVESQYAPEHSRPFQQQWFFYYTIRITNEGDDTVQLLSRHWVATDSTGHIEEVKGPGVVGEQPILSPGESFQYTSGWPLRTSSGLLRGTYQMVDEHGHHFDIEIAPFALQEPYTIH